MDSHSFVFHAYDHPQEHVALLYPHDPLYYQPPLPFAGDFLFSDSPPSVFGPPYDDLASEPPTLPELAPGPSLQLPPRRKTAKRTDKAKEKKKCMNCGATKTPTWRRGPYTRWLLCNACGLYEKVSRRRRVVTVHPDGKTKISRGAHDDPKVSLMTCAQCATSNANRWHVRDKETLCDRCARSKL